MSIKVVTFIVVSYRLLLSFFLVYVDLNLENHLVVFWSKSISFSRIQINVQSKVRNGCPENRHKYCIKNISNKKELNCF